MNTQYEKNSICLARAAMNMRRKDRELKIKLTVFFAVLVAVCTTLCTVISQIS